jgi:hypothetical protein
MKDSFSCVPVIRMAEYRLHAMDEVPEVRPVWPALWVEIEHA